MPELSHFDPSGASRMVDTTAKPDTAREARASRPSSGCSRPRSR